MLEVLHICNVNSRRGLLSREDSNSVVYCMSVALMIDATIHRSQHL